MRAAQRDRACLQDRHSPAGTFRDLLAFKRQRDRDRMASLDDLSQLSQEFGGYEEIPTDD